jgi:hypothetical protein
MSAAIDTIAMEMIVPAEDELLPTLLGSIDGFVDELGDAVADGLGDFDLEGFGVALTVFVGVGVGVGVLEARPRTTTVPLMPAWTEQW